MPVPDDRWYSEDHQWLQADGDLYRVGLTDYAQDALGEVTLVQLVDTGVRVSAGAELGEVEAFKAMTDLYMPVNATVVELNAALAENPTIVNEDPYGLGWLCRVEVERADDVDALLDGASYRALIGAA
jgi:glycine cleavage system H protein